MKSKKELINKLLFIVILMVIVTGFSLYNSDFNKITGFDKNSNTNYPAFSDQSIPGDTCDLSNNFLVNGNFSNYFYGVNGNIFPNGSSHADPWYASRSTPELMRAGGSCGDSGYVRFNGHRTTGEVLSQSGFNIISGKSYKISIVARLSPSRPISANYGRIGVSFTSGGSSTYPPIPGTYPNNYNGLIIGGNAPTTPSINSPGITDTNWVTYTYSWVATGNYNTIHLNPVNDYTSGTANLSWMDIDNVKLSTPDFLNLTALIQGFYNPSSDLMVSDEMRIYLRSNSSPYLKVDSSLSVLNPSGNGNFNFKNVLSGVNYYIQLKHRNSLETWSNNTSAFIGNTLTYNFTNTNTQAFGDNMTQVNNSPVRFAIYSGDVNHDGIIDASDMSEVENSASNSESGYIVTDLNGDNFVDAGDLSIVENNASLSISVITP